MALPSLVGLDIGTGASAIYPLLAVRTLEPPSASTFSSGAGPSSSSVRMLATDIDAHSLEYARRSVVQNGLSDRISVFEVEQGGALFPPEVVNSVSAIDFTMCNPPFYTSQDEIDASLAAKELEPFAKCTGAENEMVTPGGEVAFVSRIVEESFDLGKEKIRWFTSLLGKYSSLAPLVELLKSKEILNYHVHALPPHGHTVRWVLSWSLQDRRFPFELLDVAATSAPLPAAAPSTTPRFPLARFASPAVSSSTYYTPQLALSVDEVTVRCVSDAVEEVLRELGGAELGGEDGAPQEERAAKRRRVAGDGAGEAHSALEWRWDEPRLSESAHAELFVRAWRNVWARKARRGGAIAAAPPADAAAEPARPLLELRVRFECATPAAAQEGEPDPLAPPQVKLTAHWVRGRDADRAAFTGLWGFVTRKVGERLKAGGGGSEKAEEGEGKRDEGGGAGKRGREA
ncbi:hypothetical protein JCM10449v2_007227 [Rhodotorula kratochvilovae]